MKNCIIVLSLIFLFNCTINEESEMEILDFNLIAKGNLGGAGEEGIIKQNLVITDNTSWNSLIDKMDSVNEVSTYFTEKEIDFSEYTIIAVFEDIKSNSGFGLDIEITNNLENILVDITKIGPSPSDNVMTVIIQPFYIVKILKTDLPIVFNEN